MEGGHKDKEAGIGLQLRSPAQPRAEKLTRPHGEAAEVAAGGEGGRERGSRGTQGERGGLPAACAVERTARRSSREAGVRAKALVSGATIPWHIFYSGREAGVLLR